MANIKIEDLTVNTISVELSEDEMNLQGGLLIRGKSTDFPRPPFSCRIEGQLIVCGPIY
jgi:hypothetical protein